MPGFRMPEPVTLVQFPEKLTITKTKPLRDKKKKFDSWRSVKLLLSTDDREWWEDRPVIVAFNFPRISACLERLMGTNVVRLTDRKYMKELRENISEDYRKSLQSRIRARELKEIERERVLIIEGKSNVIPVELADDPIFVVNRIANKEIEKARSKLKTNREKNAERLKQQGMKWERERWQHEEEERVRIQLAKARQKEQKELEERYKEEDADAGMNLLRIDNEDWRPCEQQLKEFLASERAKMKARSLKVPTPYTSDQLDMQNIERAKKKIGGKAVVVPPPRAVEQEMMEQKPPKPKITDADGVVIIRHGSAALKDLFMPEEEIKRSGRASELSAVMDMEPPPRVIRDSDESSESDEVDALKEKSSTLSESQRHHAEKLRNEMMADVNQGLLVSTEQYQHLRYEDLKIEQLKFATSIRELYQLAEEIIIGDQFEDDIFELEEEEEEEGGALEGDFHIEEDDDKPQPPSLQSQHH